MPPPVPPQFGSVTPPAGDNSAAVRPATSVLRGTASLPSLPEVFRTIPIEQGASWIKKTLAFAGPGYLVAVGYMDPGNWATDIGGGSKFGYALLSVVLISNCMAMVLQAIAAKLGIVTGQDLAQACRSRYSPATNFILWIMCEIAITACDLLVVLAMQGRGFRLVETFVVTLIATIAACFAYEIFFAHPLWLEAASGFIPRA